MKKIITSIVIILIVMLSNSKINAQVTWPANAPATGIEYIGWNAIQPFALEILHQGNQPINFWTNAGVGPGPAWVKQKMIITANVNPLLDGFVGIGNSDAALAIVGVPPSPFKIRYKARLCRCFFTCKRT
jgi:hypothetical protein